MMQDSDTDGANSPAPDVYKFEVSGAETSPIELVELLVWPPRQGNRGKEFPLWSEVRIGEETIVTTAWRIIVHLTRAELAVLLDRCKFVPGTRFGDNPLPPTVDVTEKVREQKGSSHSQETSSGLTAALLKGFSGSLTEKGTDRSDSQSAAETERKSKVDPLPLKTLPKGRWEILGQKKRLRGPYLTMPPTDDSPLPPLCRISSDSENFAIAVSLEARPNDIDPDISPLEGSRFWGREPKPTKAKIAKLLVQRALTQRFERPGDERITLARVVLRGNLCDVGNLQT